MTWMFVVSPVSSATVALVVQQPLLSNSTFAQTVCTSIGSITRTSKRQLGKGI